MLSSSGQEQDTLFQSLKAPLGLQVQFVTTHRLRNGDSRQPTAAGKDGHHPKKAWAIPSATSQNLQTVRAQGSRETKEGPGSEDLVRGGGGTLGQPPTYKKCNYRGETVRGLEKHLPQGSPRTLNPSRGHQDLHLPAFVNLPHFNSLPLSIGSTSTFSFPRGS